MLPASYQFAPGHDEDGITVQLPIEALMQINPDHLERTVPGAIEDKVEAMIRALPKSVRRQLVPIPDFVKTIMPVIEVDQQGLRQAVALCVTKRTGVAIDPIVWADHHVDARLKLRIEVVDSDGLVMDVDRDLNALQERLAFQVAAIQDTESVETYHDWPLSLSLEHETLTQVGGVQIKKFQRLVLHEGDVVLKSLFDQKDALIQHQAAVAQLLVERCSDLFRFIQSKDANYQKAVVSVCHNETDQEHFKRLIVLACLDPYTEIMNHGGFVTAKQRVRERLIDHAKKVATALWSAKTRERQLKQRLGGKIPPSWLNPIAAMKAHMAELCGDILNQTPPDRLVDLDRYLKALEIRLEKLQSRLLLDSQWQQEIHQIESELKQLWPKYPADWRAQEEQLVELRWQIEEFRVLCFAQTLKTREKVSFKRLLNALREYRDV